MTKKAAKNLIPGDLVKTESGGIYEVLLPYEGVFGRIYICQPADFFGSKFFKMWVLPAHVELVNDKI